MSDLWFGVSSVEFRVSCGTCLMFRVWCFGFGFRGLVSGIWGLGFGV